MKIQDSTKKLIKLANDYRLEDDIPENGYVRIVNGKTAGWMSEIKGNEFKVLPGTWAIDKMGNKWLAIGGNDYDGAKEFQMIPHDTFNHET